MASSLPFLTGGGGIRSDTNGGATSDCYRASVLRNDSRAKVQTSESQRLLIFLLGQAARGGVTGAQAARGCQAELQRPRPPGPTADAAEGQGVPGPRAPPSLRHC